jgi:DNA-binding NtrC family response regulator
VLLIGETGTGKEVVARQIHARSARCGRPFVAADCTTLTPNLFESILFGHERGAFTGAVAPAKGLVRAADGGTLFLDEIGELPAEGQAKLLRVLQERQVLPVGATTPIDVNVRVIAATHRDLWAMVHEHTFREDLLYRLEVLRIELRPLRERLHELPRLTETLLERISAAHDLGPLAVDGDATARMLLYHWPGNVRELANCLERAAILSPDGVIRVEDLPPHVQGAAGQGAAGAIAARPKAFRDELWRHEEQVLADALARAKGNKALAAALLGIHRKQLYRLLARHPAAPTATA